MEFGTVWSRVRQTQPLVQCITNFVTVNDCANILLASGASPTMAEHPLEVEEAVSRVQALVCNLGAIDRVDSMILAGKQANRLGIPVILDPVGAGGTQLRRETVRKLLEQVHFHVIRGNASEIRFLAGQQTPGSGVDASPQDQLTRENLSFAAALARTLGTVIAISGKIDVVTDGKHTCVLENGCATMTRITGSGCMLSALTGAVCGSWEDPFGAACTATAVMGVCGEIADGLRLQNGSGNATFRNDLIDAVFSLSPQQLMEGVRYEIFEG